MRARGGTPSRVVRAATEWAQEGQAPGAAAIERLEIGWRGERPKGVRFGTLVHAVLASVELDGDRDAVAAHAAVQARLLVLRPTAGRNAAS